MFIKFFCSFFVILKGDRLLKDFQTMKVLCFFLGSNLMTLKLFVRAEKSDQNHFYAIKD